MATDLLIKGALVFDGGGSPPVEADIAVEGGINPETAGVVAEAGANILIVGSALFRAKDPAAAAQRMRVAWASRPYSPKPL